MDIAVKIPLVPELVHGLVYLLHGVCGIIQNAGAQEKTFNIIPPIEFNGQFTDLVRCKSSPHHIIGTPVHTVLTVVNALVGEQDLKQGYAPPVRRKAVTDSRLRCIPNTTGLTPALHTAGCTGHIILCRICQYLKFFLYG